MQRTHSSAGGLKCSFVLLFLFAQGKPSQVAAAEPATELIRRFEGNKDFVYCAVFSPDGNYILSGGGGAYSDNQWLPGDQDYTLWLWDVATGKSIRRLEGHTDHVADGRPSGARHRPWFVMTEGVLAAWGI